MTPRDAFFHLVSDYPGGATALAPRLGISKSTLSHKADPACTSHKPAFDEVIKAEQLTGDHRPLVAHSDVLGYRLVRRDLNEGLSNEQLVSNFARFAKEVGEALAAAQSVIADGRVTENEVEEFERQVSEIAPAALDLAERFRSIAAEQSKQRALRAVGGG